LLRTEHAERERERERDLEIDSGVGFVAQEKATIVDI
jgi:hypothetical protein